MSIKQMPGRVLISLLLSVTGLLSGCASHNENASLLAKKQAQNISQNLPIKSAGYTLVLAQSSGTTVKMTIISEAGTQTTQTPDAFLTSYQRQMCADPTVKLMIPSWRPMTLPSKSTIFPGSREPGRSFSTTLA